ncbi:MAG: beta-propeller domain-containing protein [Deltaproteobacteria bacterium]|nr:beta-propeller domain-containing protein [Deltaproteobacteria bacterium]
MRSPLKWFALALLVAFAACVPWKEEQVKISPRGRTTATLRSFASCDELADALRSALTEEMRVRLLQLEDYGWRYGGLEDGTNAPAPDSSTGHDSSRQEGVDYSGTNNQEAGVDEADFVKTDGYYLYLLNGNRLEVMGVPVVGRLDPISTTPIEGRPGQMLIGNDKAVVFSNIHTYDLPEDHPLRALVGTGVDGGWWYYSAVLTKLTVIDLADRSAPRVVRELYIDGYYQTARKVQSSVRAISFSWMDIPGLKYWPELPREYYDLPYDDPRRETMWDDAIAATIRYNDAIIAVTSLADFVPQIYERFASGAIVQHPFTGEQCRSFGMADDAISHGITSILSLDLLGSQFTFDADHIVSNWSTVYASTDTLLIAEPAQDWWWFWSNDTFDEASNIHRFDISRPGLTSYTGSGRIDGWIQDQFSLSEQDGFIRVAATTGQWGRWWQENPPPPENHVFVLAGGSEPALVGRLDGIAVGERIWSSRFVGDRGYLVTFRNIDPLWTIDLSTPTQPRIIGELEVPGVSTYIHPMDAAHLLTIGYGGDEDGLNWAAQVSLFDVGDFAHPQMSSALSLAPDVDGTGWSWGSAWSEAMYEHKAFTYFAPMKMLAIPLSTYRGVYDQVSGYYDYEYRSLLQIINAEAGVALTRFATVDHSDFFNSAADCPRDYCYWEWQDVRRSIFMRDATLGDFVYAISDRGVTAHRVSDMSLSASVALPGTGYDTPCWD